MIQRLRQYIIDSYNGLYKIVLKPSMPTKQTIILLVLGIVIGMVWGYVISPTIFYDADPSQLSKGWREEWVKLVAGSKEGLNYADEGIVNLLQQVENPAATVEELIGKTDGTLQARLQQIQPIAPAIGTPAPKPTSFVSQLLGLLVPIIIVVILTPVLVLIWRLLFYPNIVAPLWDRIRPKSAEELRQREAFAAEKAARLAAIEAQKSIVVQEDAQLGKPVIQKLAVYTKGRQFDESFAIEDANEMFLGECGASRAKSIGESNELAAIEVWLFDKEDFVRTLTKVFVSEHGYNDPATRAELENRVDNPATDIVPVREGAKLILETDAIRLQATVRSVAYGTGPLPPNSFFESIQIEIAAWQKSAAGVSMPAVPTAAYAPPTPTYTPPAAPAFTPPPPATSPAPMPRPAVPQTPPTQPASTPSIRPLSPPPMPPKPQDDDPFGGTGDFTPISS